MKERMEALAAELLTSSRPAGSEASWVGARERGFEALRTRLDPADREWFLSIIRHEATVAVVSKLREALAAEAAPKPGSPCPRCRSERVTLVADDKTPRLRAECDRCYHEWEPSR